MDYLTFPHMQFIFGLRWTQMWNMVHFLNVHKDNLFCDYLCGISLRTTFVHSLVHDLVEEQGGEVLHPRNANNFVMRFEHPFPQQ